MVDWRYRFANADQTVEDFYLELGLYRLNRKKSGKRWQASPLVDKFKNYVNNSKSAVGSVRQAPERLKNLNADLGHDQMRHAVFYAGRTFPKLLHGRF